MISIETNLATTSSMIGGLQRIVNRGGSADLGSIIGTALKWTRRGLDYARRHPTIAIVGLGAIVGIGVIRSLSADSVPSPTRSADSSPISRDQENHSVESRSISNTGRTGYPVAEIAPVSEVVGDEEASNFFETIERGDLDAVTALIEARPTLLNARYKVRSLFFDEGPYNTGKTALHMAVLSGRVDIVNAFITASPDLVNAQDNHGRTALHLAAIYNSLDIATALITASLDLVNAQDHRGQIALHLAATYNSLDTATALIRTRPDLVNAQDNQGQTALHTAAFRGNVDIVNALIRARADILITDNTGSRADHVAIGDSADILRIAVANRRVQDLKRQNV